MTLNIFIYYFNMETPYLERNYPVEKECRRGVVGIPSLGLDAIPSVGGGRAGDQPLLYQPR